MECNWNLHDLLDAKKNLKTILRNEKDYNQKSYIRALLKSIKEYIEEEQELESLTLSPSIIEPQPTSTIRVYNENLTSIEDDLVACQEYYSLVTLFAKTTDSLQPNIDEIEDILSQRLQPEDGFGKITGIKISNEKALSLTSIFYQNFSSSLYPIFQKAYNQRHNSIRYIDTLDNDCVANSTYIDIINRYFISMTKTDDLSKLYNFIHEYGHVISYIINPKSAYLSCEYIFNEVASLFPELVAQYENIGNFNRAHVSFESYLSLVLYRTKAIDFTAHKPFIIEWNKHNRIADKEYLSQIEKDYNFDQENFEKAIETYIEDEGIYIISYMIALELLHIYKKDKQKALKIFEEFLKIPYTQSAQSYLESELSIGKHLAEETEDLLISFKKELKKSGDFRV